MWVSLMTLAGDPPVGDDVVAVRAQDDLDVVGAHRFPRREYCARSGHVKKWET